jgi:hypothetical protein
VFMEAIAPLEGDCKLRLSRGCSPPNWLQVPLIKNP